MKSFKIILSSLLLLVIATSSTCVQKKVYTNKTYPIHSFSSVESEAVAKVIYTQTNEVSVRAEGDQDMIDNLIITESNGVLKINHIKKIRARNKKNLTIHISSPTIEEFEIEGVGNWIMEGKVTTDKLKIDFEGVGNFEALNLESREIIATYEGVGNLTIGGTTEFVDIESEGVGSINAQDLKAKHAVIESSGVGSVKCYASESIDIKNNGVGSITYYGNPTIKNVTNSGVGKIKPGE